METCWIQTGVDLLDSDSWRLTGLRQVETYMTQTSGDLQDSDMWRLVGFRQV